MKQNGYKQPPFLFTFLFFIPLLFISSANGTQLDQKHVLLLHSYQQNMTWVTDITKAVNDILQPEQRNIILHIENMDTKRFSGDAYYQSLFNRYRIKYKDIPLSLILSSDNNALDFLLKQRQTLFPDVPVSFCGINYFKEEQLQGQKNYTGVVENFDARNTVETALRLHPNTKKIYIINDYLKSGRACVKTIREQLQGLRKDIELEWNENLSIEQMQKKIENLSQESLILLGSFFADRNMRYLTFEKMGAILSDHSKVPVHALFEFNLQRGVVGGNVISGYYQGEAMSKLGLRILSGETADQLPIITTGVNKYIFDYRQLQRFSIPKSDLPAGSLVIHHPFSLYETYKMHILSVAALIAALLFVVSLLMISIRRRRQSEYALKESERKLSGIFNHTFQFIGLLSAEGNILNINQSALIFAGIEEGTIFNRPFWETEWWQHSTKEQERLKKAIENARHGDFIRYETTHRDHLGELRTIDFSLQPIFDDRERVTYLISEGRDITESTKTRQELKRLRLLLQNIINSMPSILIGVNLEGMVNQWNREAEKLTGISATEAMDSPLHTLHPIFHHLEIPSHFKNDSRKPIEIHKLKHTLEGKIRIHNVTIYPLTDDIHRGAVIRIDDVTEKVWMEETMTQSEKMLSVGGLAAGMAHELNNPLGGILQGMQVVKNRLTQQIPKNLRAAEMCGMEFSQISAYVDRREILTIMDSVADSGKRAAKIVDNMLSFSRKGDSRVTFEDIPILIEKTIDLASNDYNLRKHSDFRQIEILRHHPPNLPKIPCEETKIQQVILNILKNGAQAMALNDGETPPRFTIRIQTEDRVMIIEIEDNGPGMDEATRKRAFEPFFTTKEVGVGTGLGLSVSYFIITKDHGGSLSVESSPGHGCCFRIKLPFDNVEPPAQSDLLFLDIP